MNNSWVINRLLARVDVVGGAGVRGRLLAQVSRVDGAGGVGFWRRCAFWMGTCAANVVPARYSGAGTTSFSAPAPSALDTCAIGKGVGEGGV